MRPSGLTSTAPNFAKSTSGTFGNAPPVAGAPVLSACLTQALTSSAVTRAFGPLPLTAGRSTPSSRANLRTEGLACTWEKSTATATGAADGCGCFTGAGAGVGAGDGAVGAGAASFALGRGWG